MPESNASLSELEGEPCLHQIPQHFTPSVRVNIIDRSQDWLCIEVGGWRLPSATSAMSVAPEWAAAFAQPSIRIAFAVRLRWCLLGSSHQLVDGDRILEAFHLAVADLLCGESV